MECSGTTYEFHGGKFINVSPVVVNTEPENTFTASRKIPCVGDPDVHLDDPGLFLFGTGKYRDSAVYLAWVPLTETDQRTSYRYYTGVPSDCWSDSEEDAAPVVLGEYAEPERDVVPVGAPGSCEFRMGKRGAGELSATRIRLGGSESTFLLAATGFEQSPIDASGLPTFVNLFYSPDGLPWNWESMQMWIPPVVPGDPPTQVMELRDYCNPDDEYPDPVTQSTYGPYFAHGTEAVGSDGRLSIYHMASTWSGNSGAPYSVESRKLTMEVLPQTSIWEVYAASRADSMGIEVEIPPEFDLAPLPMYSILMNSLQGVSLSWLASAQHERLSSHGFVLSGLDGATGEWSDSWFLQPQEDEEAWTGELESTMSDFLSTVPFPECDNPSQNDGCRSTGAGIRSAVQLPQAQEVARTAIVVFSDGGDDALQAPGYESVPQVLRGYPEFGSSSPDMHYYTVALGESAEDLDLYDLSTFSGGAFHDSPTALDIPEIVQSIEADIHGTSAIYTWIDQLQRHSFVVSPQDSEITILFATNATSAPLARELSITAPADGFGVFKEIVPGARGVHWLDGGNSIVVKIDSPQPGLWTVQESAGGQPLPASLGIEHVFLVSSRGTYEVEARPTERKHEPGQPARIEVLVSNGEDPIDGALVEAQVVYDEVGLPGQDQVDTGHDLLPHEDVDIVQDGAGRYLVSFTPPVSGTYTIRIVAHFVQYEVTFSRKERLSLVVLPADPTTEVNDSPGSGTSLELTDTVLVTGPSSQTEARLMLVDIYGLPAPERDVFFTTTHGLFTGDVVDHGNGLYSQALLAGTEAGEASIGAGVARNEMSAYRVSELASLEILPGPAAPDMSGLRLESGLDFLYRGKEDGLEALIVDAFGNPAGPDEDVEFLLMESGGARLEGEVRYTDGGTYRQTLAAPDRYSQPVIGLSVNGSITPAVLTLPVLDDPPWSEDCDSDGLPDSLHDHPCTLDSRWWAQTGHHVCLDGVLQCDARVSDLVTTGWYPLPWVRALDELDGHIVVARGRKLEVLEPGGTCWGPSVVARIDLGSPVLDMAIEDSLAFLGTYRGITVVDISDAADPVMIAQHEMPWPVVSLDVRHGYIHAVDGIGLTLLKLAGDPVFLEEVSAIDVFECSSPLRCYLRALLGSPHPMAVGPGVAVLADDDRFHVVDLSSRSYPVIASEYVAMTEIEAIRVYDGHAYATGEGNNEIVDIRVLHEPEYAGFHDVEWWVRGVVHVDDMAYRVVSGYLQEAEVSFAD